MAIWSPEDSSSTYQAQQSKTPKGRLQCIRGFERPRSGHKCRWPGTVVEQGTGTVPFMAIDLLYRHPRTVPARFQLARLRSSSENFAIPQRERNRGSSTEILGKGGSWRVVGACEIWFPYSMGQNTNHQVSPNLSESSSTTWAECLESDMLRQEIMVKIHIFASDTHGGIVTFNTFQSILDPTHHM